MNRGLREDEHGGDGNEAEKGQRVHGRRRSVHGETRPVVRDTSALKLSFEPVGLTAQFACLASPFPRRPAPPALAEPGRSPADDEAESERAKQEEEEGRLKRIASLASPERIENEGRFGPIDDGKRDQHEPKRHDDESKNELTPHWRGLSYGTR